MKEFNPKDQDKVICIEALIHSADISNPIKPFPIYFKWTERVLEEFFNQVIIIFDMMNKFLLFKRETKNEQPAFQYHI